MAWGVLRPSRWEWLALGAATAIAVWSALSYQIAGGRSHAWSVGALVAVTAYLTGRVVAVRWRMVPAVVLAVGAVVLPLVPADVGAVLGAPPSGRPFGPLVYANASAALFVVAAGACLFVFALRSGAALTTVAGLGVLWCGGIVVASGSRAATVGLAVVGAAALARRARTVRWVQGVAVGVLAAALVVPWVIAVAPAEGRVVEVAARALSDARVSLWRDAATLTATEPAVGVGPGNFAVRSPAARADEDRFAVHNLSLEAGAELGTPGLLLLVLVVIGVVGTFLRAPARPAAAIGTALLVAVGLQAAVDYVLWAPGVVGSVAVLVGSAVSVASWDGTGKPGLTPPVPVMP